MARTKGNSRAGIGCLTVFLGLFVLGFGGLGGWGVYQQWRVRGFAPVDGVVTHSEVGESSDDDGTTYYPDIRFRYTVDGRQYDTGNYRIQRISSSGRQGKARIVGRFPVGSKVQGWYDPRDPGTAVIDRSFSFFPVIFLGIGSVALVVLVLVWMGHFRGWSSRGGASLAAGGVYAREQAPRGADVPLKPYRRAGQVTGFAGTLVFAIIWNGVWWVLACFLWFGSEESLPLVFKLGIGACLVIGVLAVTHAIKLGLAQMKLAPPEVQVSAHPLRVGETFELRFRQQAKAPLHVQQVTARLVCREYATYRRGTDSTSVQHDVYEQRTVLVQELAANSVQPITGSARLAVPADGMHSFRASNNQVLWFVEVNTAVDDWPDYFETFELQVLPERMISGEAV